MKCILKHLKYKEPSVTECPHIWQVWPTDNYTAAESCILQELVSAEEQTSIFSDM
jgi:hypothetical protein